MRAAIVAFALVSLAAEALAQTAVIQVTQGPYYVQAPIDLQVVADGFDEEPQPEVQVDPPAAGKLEFVQARPQISSFMQIINGQVTQRKDVRYAFVFRFTADAPGRYTIGPVRLTQGTKSAETKTLAVTVGEVPEAQGQRFRLVIPQERIFVGERVPVTVEWWTESGLAERLFNQTMHVPLFERTNEFQFIDTERPPSRIVLNVNTAGGAVDFPADVRQVNEGGKQWVIRSVTRTMIPVVAGTFALPAATLLVDEATGWRRDFFGSRVPTQTRKLRVTADARTLVIEQVPAAGRPPSFAGAIGEGFTLDVSADRTVLQAGDPVKLTLTLRGAGSLESAALPPLSSAGLSPKQFRVPDSTLSGVLEEGAKKFEATVRVVDPSVREIPAIEYSWFDPKTASYQTTRSQPIALSVRAAEVVGAGDVVSAAPQAEPQEEDQPAADEKAEEETKERRTFTLTGADLSIETDRSRLTAASTSALAAPAVRWIAYALGLLALLIGLLVHRRRQIDPEQARLARLLRTERSHVADAATAREVGDALRRMAAANPAARPADLDAVLRSCDEIVFAPGGGSAPVPGDLRSRAVAAADQMVKP
ncbi:MAG TPA: BatD family protein [Candidatus Limnocylindrales bacterium]|nr:BatD family protein [Candidatus Limnocylindrales bacterium]